MTRYNTLNVTLSNSELNKLTSAIENGTEVTLNLSSNLIESSNGETNFPYKLFLTNTQVSKICKAFANGSSANIKCSKTQFWYNQGDTIKWSFLSINCSYARNIVSSRKEIFKKGISLAPKLAPTLGRKEI